MCGITGFWTSRNDGGFEHIAQCMANAMTHRGPDDCGVWSDPESGLFLAHRRLSILDLSPAGHQPMGSACGRYVIIFNGEIYNFAEIRKEIEQTGYAHTWRGHSDTEILLAGFSLWGLEATLKRCVGMFAIALWDREEHKLYLARDRFGEKPLYYGQAGDAFVFGSELKALGAHPGFGASVDRQSLALYLQYSYVPEPRSIYAGISKLLPGHILCVEDCGKKTSLTPYWSVREVLAQAQTSVFQDERTSLDRLHDLLNQAVAQQMVADVPVGAFLSGGIDSSLIVALMRQNARAPIHTFSIGFTEAAYDESAQARAVAQHLGTEHSELIVTSDDLLGVVPRLPHLYDEPFGDSSQVPTFLVAQLARSKVTVCLSGDAGDEVFGGYNRYRWAESFWRRVAAVPLPMRQAGASILSLLSPQQWDKFYEVFENALAERFRMRLPGEKIHKFARALSSRNERDLYARVTSLWDNPASVVLQARDVNAILDAPDCLTSVAERMMYLDQMTYLPGDILVKVDRAGMGVSLESRIPFLDHRVIEYAWGLPLSMKVRHGQGKWALRQLLDRYLPRELVDRPKMGFGVPIETWLRGPLKSWAESLLDETRLRSEGYFETEAIRKLWTQHLDGSRNWHHRLWNVLMFQAWLEQQKQ